MEQNIVVPDLDEIPLPKIKNLLKSTGVDAGQIDALRQEFFQTAMRKLAVYQVIVNRGGNIHKVHPKGVAKRRAANKVAARQRKVNNDRTR